MSYHFNGKIVALGSSDDPVGNIAKKCTTGAAGQSLDTKAAREAAFKNAAECAADGACAYFSGGSVPPGVCSAVAGPVADFVISGWNSVFGNQDEWEAYYAARAATAKHFANLNKAFDLDLVQGQALNVALTRIIEFAEKVIPSRSSRFGYGRHEQPGKTPPVYYTNEKGAGEALSSAGASIVARPDAHGDPAFYSWRPSDNIGQTFMQIDDEQGRKAAEKFVTGEAIQIVESFLDSLQEAEAKVSTQIIATASALAAAEANTAVLIEGAKKAREKRKGQGLLLLGAGALAGGAVFLWRRR